jgi:hypothetical protein
VRPNSSTLWLRNPHTDKGHLPCHAPLSKICDRACRTAGDEFAIPTFDLTPRDVARFTDELQEFQGLFHDCFPRSEPRAHFFDYMVGQLSPLERKSIEPMALRVPGGSVRGLQRFLSEVPWDEEHMRWT